MGRGRNSFDILEVELIDFADELMWLGGEEKREIKEVMWIFNVTNWWIVKSLTHWARCGIVSRF